MGFMKQQRTFINVATVVILLIVFIAISMIAPNRRGFWCSDETIKYRKQEETVDVKQLALISLLLPLFVIIFCESIACKGSQSQWLMKLIKNKRISRNPSSESSSATSSTCQTNIGSTLFSWFFSLALTAILTGLIKVQIGRLRPVFYHMCSPNVSCDDPVNQGVYVTNYTCLSADAKTENFIRSSFPSGHSSYTISSMVFLIVYLAKRFNGLDKSNTWRYLLALIQTIFLSIGLYVALSRVTDNIHHWSDVLAGLLIGTLVTLLSTLILDNLDGSRASGHDYQSAKSDPQTKDDYPEQLATF